MENLQFEEAKEDQVLVPEKFAQYEISPYFLNNHGTAFIWILGALLISIVCFFSLRILKKPAPTESKFR